MRPPHVLPLILVVLTLGLTLGVRSASEPDGGQPGSAFSSVPTNMLPYLNQVHATLKANTGASNMTDQQVLTLMNEAARTNLGSELLSRNVTYSIRSSKAAEIAKTVRVLECLREGKTNEAIRRLEEELEVDVSTLGIFLDASSTIGMPTSNHLDSLQFVKDYWQKFPRATTNSARDYGISHALSLLDKK